MTFFKYLAEEIFDLNIGNDETFEVDFLPEKINNFYFN